jgi:hypothetical protein
VKPWKCSCRIEQSADARFGTSTKFREFNEYPNTSKVLISALPIPQQQIMKQCAIDIIVSSKAQRGHNTAP